MDKNGLFLFKSTRRLLTSFVVELLEQTTSGYALLNPPRLSSKYSFLSQNPIFETSSNYLLSDKNVKDGKIATLVERVCIEHI